MAEQTNELTPTKSLTVSAQYRADLEHFERDDGRAPYHLNVAEIKLLGITGVRL